METKNLETEIIGNRILIQKHELDLAETMFSYVNKDRTRLDKFLPWVDLINTLEDEVSYIKSTHKKWDERVLFDYGIFLKNEETYLGNIGLHSIDWASSSVEIGYWLLGDFEGLGYMSEAVLLLEKYLFSIGFHRIQICCSNLNKRSERVPIRCKYTFEGSLRENRFEKGEYRSTKVFSKLSTDVIDY